MTVVSASGMMRDEGFEQCVIVPVGGSTPVAAAPAGSCTTTPMPEDVIFAHEAYGHALDKDAVQLENEYGPVVTLPLGHAAMKITNSMLLLLHLRSCFKQIHLYRQLNTTEAPKETKND